MSTETRSEWRALVRRPASILDSPEQREVGYVLEWTSYGDSSEAVKRDSYLLSRPEETHATVVKWQRRTVTCGPWETVVPEVPLRA